MLGLRCSIGQGSFPNFFRRLSTHGTWTCRSGRNKTDSERLSGRNYSVSRMDSPELAVANLLNIARATQSPPAYLLLAAANMKADEWENALTVLDILHCMEPDLPEANLLKGFVHGYFNRFGQGKSCLQAAVEQAPRLAARVDCVDRNGDGGRFESRGRPFLD